MTHPPGLFSTPEHEWLHFDGAIVTVGITAFAAQALGDVLLVQLPAVGDHVLLGQECADLESSKATASIEAPTEGTVVAVNEALADNPGLVNADPFDDGWLFRIEYTQIVPAREAAAGES